jgi:hypothetical protein
VRSRARALRGACAPPGATPAHQQRPRDRTAAAARARELSALPGAIDAHVTLSRPSSDPFTGTRSPAASGAVVLVDDHCDVAAISRAARALVRAAVPEAEPIIAVQLAGSREPVRPWRGGSALAALLAFVATLAGCIAWRERWRVLGR